MVHLSRILCITHYSTSICFLAACAEKNSHVREVLLSCYIYQCLQNDWNSLARDKSAVALWRSTVAYLRPMFRHSRRLVISGDILAPLCATAKLPLTLTDPRSGISRLFRWEIGENTNLSNMYFSSASILLYFETHFVPVHYNLRSPPFFFSWVQDL